MVYLADECYGEGQANSLRSTRMARPYSDDLRRKILETYAQGEVTLEQLAGRFRVSYGYVKKLRRQQLRHGQMERVRAPARTQAQVHRADS